MELSHDIKSYQALMGGIKWQEAKSGEGLSKSKANLGYSNPRCTVQSQ